MSLQRNLMLDSKRSLVPRAHTRSHPQFVAPQSDQLISPKILMFHQGLLQQPTTKPPAVALKTGGPVRGKIRIKKTITNE